MDVGAGRTVTLDEAAVTLSSAEAGLGEEAERFERWAEALYVTFRASRASDEPPVKLDDYARRTAPVVCDTLRQQLGYTSLIEGLLFDLDQHEDWQRVCHARSAAEVVKALYAGCCSDGDPFTAPADTEYVDGLIEELAEQWGLLRDDEIPGEIPPSHWWWWAPRTPPAEQAGTLGG